MFKKVVGSFLVLMVLAALATATLRPHEGLYSGYFPGLGSYGAPIDVPLVGIETVAILEEIDAYWCELKPDCLMFQ